MVIAGSSQTRAALGLAELGAVGLGDQRRGERVHRPGAAAADEVDAGGDVAPLVGAAELQRAAVPLVQLEEVVRLQQLVAELGEADAASSSRALTTSRASIRLTGKCLPTSRRNSIADIGAGPVQVVDQRAALSPVEVDERLELARGSARPSRRRPRAG